MSKKIRKTVNYKNDSLYYYNDEILIFVKDGAVLGSMTTGLDILDIMIHYLPDSLAWANKETQLEITDSIIKRLLKKRKEFENEKNDS